ncbi:hypothetical protein UVI_02033180 [Ustilaginoidea virens]|nr:hypothetical protein UVI_02033180 [Ustilaginoidea virens]
MPPGTTNDDWIATLWSGIWRLWYLLPREGRKRFFDEVFPILHDTKAEIMGNRTDDCYYLGYIGTKASARGRGYATKLLDHMIYKADEDNRAIYLESSHVRNNKFYAKFGFEIKKEIVLTRGPRPIRLYCMVREPQNDKSSTSVADLGTDKE